MSILCVDYKLKLKLELKLELKMKLCCNSVLYIYIYINVGHQETEIFLSEYMFWYKNIKTALKTDLYKKLMCVIIINDTFIKKKTCFSGIYDTIWLYQVGGASSKWLFFI